MNKSLDFFDYTLHKACLHMLQVTISTVRCRNLCCLLIICTYYYNKRQLFFAKLMRRQCPMSFKADCQASNVQGLDSAIQWINHFPLENYDQKLLSQPLDLSSDIRPLNNWGLIYNRASAREALQQRSTMGKENW